MPHTKSAFIQISIATHVILNQSTRNYLEKLQEGRKILQPRSPFTDALDFGELIKLMPPSAMGIEEWRGLDVWLQSHSDECFFADLGKVTSTEMELSSNSFFKPESRSVVIRPKSETSPRIIWLAEMTLNDYLQAIEDHTSWLNDWYPLYSQLWDENCPRDCKSDRTELYWGGLHPDTQNFAREHKKTLEKLCNDGVDLSSEGPLKKKLAIDKKMTGSVFSKILAELPEQKQLIQAVSDRDGLTVIDEESPMVQCRYIYQNGDRWRAFSPLFERYVLRQQKEISLKEKIKRVWEDIIKKVRRVKKIPGEVWIAIGILLIRTVLTPILRLRWEHVIILWILLIIIFFMRTIEPKLRRRPWGPAATVVALSLLSIAAAFLKCPLDIFKCPLDIFIRKDLIRIVLFEGSFVVFGLMPNFLNHSWEGWPTIGIYIVYTAIVLAAFSLFLLM